MHSILVSLGGLSKPLFESEPEGSHPSESKTSQVNILKPQGLLYRLDYVFTSYDIKTSSFKVEKTKGSDHLPVSTIIEI